MKGGIDGAVDEAVVGGGSMQGLDACGGEPTGGDRGWKVNRGWS